MTGWNAPPITAAIEAADDLDLTAGVSRSAAGPTLAEVTGLAVEEEIFGSVSEALEGAAFDVLVDYTSATAVRGNALAAPRPASHVVIGSSGLGAEDYAELDEVAHEHGCDYADAAKPDVPSGTPPRADRS